jgi:hypothetical protein
MVVRFTNLSTLGHQRLRRAISNYYMKKVKRLAAEK